MCEKMRGVAAMPPLRFVLLTFIIILLLSCICSAQSKNETIVYEHGTGANPLAVDIYSMNADGTNVKALNQDVRGEEATWSPDGRFILFFHTILQLWVMDRDGGNPHLVHRSARPITRAAWSPDGKTIVVTVSNRPSTADMPKYSTLRVAPDGQGEPKLLYSHEYCCPFFSPDGRKVAYAYVAPSSFGTGAVYAANADGSGKAQLTEQGPVASFLAWSPDGKQIAFSDGREIFVMNQDGSSLRQLTNDPDWYNGCFHPSWSPDGKRITFFCKAKDYASNTCGTGLHSIGAPQPTCLYNAQIFVISVENPPQKLVPINNQDGMNRDPAFAPVN